MTQVPLFPLGLVLFPGMQLPLHIFEPRYRAMLADVRAADGRFGIVLRTGDDERAIPRGYVGCFATVREAVPLGDGRSNILVDAGERFAVERLIDAGTPYHVAEVRPFHDEPVRDPAALTDAAGRTRAAFARVVRAARTLADELPAVAPDALPGLAAHDASSRSPTLPDDDASLAFVVAAAVELELETRQRILASSDSAERTAYVAQLLERAIPDVETRAALHVRARSNGHSTQDTST